MHKVKKKISTSLGIKPTTLLPSGLVAQSIEERLVKSRGCGFNPGHEIAPDTFANAPKFSLLATKIRKLVATLATRALCFILLLCIVQ